MDNLIKIIPIGSKVIVNNIYEGMIIQVAVRKKRVSYEVQQTGDTPCSPVWAEDWEITSKVKEFSILSQCLVVENT